MKTSSALGLVLAGTVLAAVPVTSQDPQGVRGEYGSIHNVTQDTFHATIQDAIDAAVSQDEIEVGPGTYHERINMQGKAITLRSTDGAASTTIDGDAATIRDGDSGSVITCVSRETAATVIVGFTITNGYASLGGGMYNRFSSPTVTNCTFTGNSAGGGGAGGGMYNLSGEPTVTNCAFSANSAQGGGGMYSTESSPTVTDCTFTGNTAGLGGGMYNFLGSPAVHGCEFSGNASSGLNSGGGGMFNLSCDPTVTESTFNAKTRPSAMAVGCATTTPAQR